MEPVVVGIVALAVGAGLGFLVRKAVAQSQAQSAEARAQKVVLEAEREAERLTREALVEAKDEISPGGRRRRASARREVERQSSGWAPRRARSTGRTSDLEKRSGS
jgi:ribonuclease Y